MATLNRSFILLLLLHNAELQMVFLVYALIIFPYEVSFSLRRRTPPMAPKAYCLCFVRNKMTGKINKNNGNVWVWFTGSVDCADCADCGNEYLKYKVQRSKVMLTEGTAKPRSRK